MLSKIKTENVDKMEKFFSYYKRIQAYVRKRGHLCEKVKKIDGCHNADCGTGRHSDCLQ